MATTKKTKNTSTKKTAPKKAVKSRKKSVPARGGVRRQIGLRPETSNFMSFRATADTLNWIVLGVVVILFTLWLMHLQASIQALYDQVDADNAAALSIPTKTK